MPMSGLLSGTTITFQPLLCQVATALVAPSDLATPIRQLARRQENLTMLLAEVSGLAEEGGAVLSGWPGVGSGQVAFDYLIAEFRAT
jgi:NADH dehydrogenase